MDSERIERFRAEMERVIGASLIPAELRVAPALDSVIE
jgi:hypothetical protein